jgi:hypothetical protein
MTGYFSTTNRLKTRPTEQQASLAKISCLSSLEILEKLCYNVTVDPKEPKYRRIRMSNPKIKDALVDGALDALLLLGWEKEGEGDEATLVLPVSKSLTMSDVRDIQNAQQELKKEKSKSMTLSSRSSSLSDSSINIQAAV